MQWINDLSDQVPASVWLVMVMVLLILWWRATHRTGRENARRGRIARKAEDRAERMLKRAGYDILDRQVQGLFVFLVDDEEVQTTCRADLLVGRRGKQLIAEVKSGDTVTNPAHPATRRQLLEYQLAFDVDGLLLVDMHHERIREVAFPVETL